jgi:septal ring factor EnvC (AmiA/AmiB activator)
MTGTDGKPDRLTWRRWNGQWIWPGKKLERAPVLKAILKRSWYLLMPLLGIMCSQDSYVRPHLVGFEDTTNREKKIFLDKRDNLRMRLSSLEADIYNVETEMDTTVRPQIEVYESFLDSLVTIRQEYDRTLPEAEAMIDSLKQELADLKGMSRRASRLLASKIALRDSLGTAIDSMYAMVEVLDDTIQAREELVYRILHPGEFRKKTAIFPGKGEYPNRDRLPRRK